MKLMYFINVFFCGFLFLSSIGLMVATFTMVDPSKEILGCLCILFATGMVGSYGYYSNAKDLRKRMNRINQIKY